MRRQVEVMKWVPVAMNPSEKQFVGLGEFQQYGVDYEEYDNGIGNFSTAIVEMNDGTVVNVPVDLIKFRDTGLA